SVGPVEGNDLREVLTAFGCQLMSLYMSPSVISIYRTVVAEAHRLPDLAKAFYAAGPARATKRLADILHIESAAGRIHVENCVHAADHFIGMIRDNLHLQVVLG